MRPAVLREHNVLPAIEEVDIQEPRQNEVMVRIAASGICGSDIHVLYGTSNVKDCMPITLGHEGAGMVEAVGPA